jgi:hypothetical protein
VILLAHHIDPATPHDNERLSLCGLCWIAYFLAMPLIIWRLA